MTIIPRLCRIRNKITNQEFKVFYVGTNTGRIYKIVQFMRDGEAKSKLLDIFEIATNEAIQVIEISQKHKSLYVSTNHRIKQIALEMCNHRYDSCFRCVKDPYCGWDQEANACKPYGIGLLQVRSNYFSLKTKIIVWMLHHLGCCQRNKWHLWFKCVKEQNHCYVRTECSSRMLWNCAGNIEGSTSGVVSSF